MRTTISAEPAALMAMLALAGGVVGQVQADEQRIAELIEALKGSYWPDAMDELIRIGKPAVAQLGKSLETDLGKPAGAQAWKLHALDALIAMCPDSVDAFSDIDAAIGVVPVELLPKLIRAFGEIGPYAGTDPASLDFVEWLGVGIGRSLRNELSRARTRLEMGRSNDMGEIVNWLRGGGEVAPSDATDIERHSREYALELLAAQGTEGAASLNLVESILTKSRDHEVIHRKAVDAMIAIAPDNHRSVIAYVWRLNRHLDAEIRRESARRLGHFGEDASAAVNNLVKATEDDAIVAREAITALGMIGPGARDAIPTLQQLTEHEDPQIAERANAALRQIRR